MAGCTSKSFCNFSGPLLPFQPFWSWIWLVSIEFGTYTFFETPAQIYHASKWVAQFLCSPSVFTPSTMLNLQSSHRAFFPGVVAAGLLFSTHCLDGAPHDAAGQQGAGDGGLRLRQPDAWLKGFMEVSVDGYNFNVNPGLINHGLLIRGYPPNSHNMILWAAATLFPRACLPSTLALGPHCSGGPEMKWNQQPNAK